MAQTAHTDSYSSSHGSTLAVVDSGTSMYILKGTTFLTNLREHHVAVASFSGDTSRSTHTGDFFAFARTSNDRLAPLIDLNSALVVPDS